MKSAVYTMAIETFVPLLGTLSKLLDKGAEHARTKQIDPGTLVRARLAPDMYPLATQVQIACYQALAGVARLTGGAEPPRFESQEEDLEALKARIQQTIDTLKQVPESAFDGAEERVIKLPLLNDLVLEMKGPQFLREWNLAHFYFHLVTAYDILRHSGVELGKPDYMSHVAGSLRKRRPDET